MIILVFKYITDFIRRKILEALDYIKYGSKKKTNKRKDPEIYG